MSDIKEYIGSTKEYLGDSVYATIDDTDILLLEDDEDCIYLTLDTIKALQKYLKKHNL